MASVRILRPAPRYQAPSAQLSWWRKQWRLKPVYHYMTQSTYRELSHALSYLAEWSQGENALIVDTSGNVWCLGHLLHEQDWPRLRILVTRLIKARRRPAVAQALEWYGYARPMAGIYRLVVLLRQPPDRDRLRALCVRYEPTLTELLRRLPLPTGPNVA